MKNKKVFLTKVFYSLYMGIIMGFMITSGFLVIIVNIDRYFFNSIIGISGDWLYYTATMFLIPIFGMIFIYNKRIVIHENVLEIREKSHSLNISKIEISKMKSISLFTKKSQRRDKIGIKFVDGDTSIVVLIRPFSKNTITKLINDLLRINSNIIIDDYYTDFITIK